MTQNEVNPRPATSAATNGVQTGALSGVTGLLSAAGAAYLANTFGIDPAIAIGVSGIAAGALAGVLASLGSAARDYAHATPPTSLLGRFFITGLSKLG